MDFDSCFFICFASDYSKGQLYEAKYWCQGLRQSVTCWSDTVINNHYIVSPWLHDSVIVINGLLPGTVTLWCMKLKSDPDFMEIQRSRTGIQQRCTWCWLKAVNQLRYSLTGIHLEIEDKYDWEIPVQGNLGKGVLISWFNCKLAFRY